MEGPYKLLQAEQAQFGNWAGSASRSLYSPSMFYSLFILNEKMSSIPSRSLKAFYPYSSITDLIQIIDFALEVPIQID